MHARKIYVSKEAPKYSIHREQQLACAGIVTCTTVTLCNITSKESHPIVMKWVIYTSRR